MPPSKTHTQPGPWIPRLPQGSFGERLRLLRYSMDLSVDAIASRCGVPAPTWHTWERGSRPRKMDEQVDAIAKATGVDRNWLMWGAGSIDTDPDGPDTLGGAPSTCSIRFLGSGDPSIPPMFREAPVKAA
jgi:transcriptional regulator with XRE-family HTH domain